MKLDLHTILAAIATIVLALSGSGVIATRTANDKAPQYEIESQKWQVWALQSKVGELEARLARLEVGALP